MSAQLPALLAAAYWPLLADRCLLAAACPCLLSLPSSSATSSHLTSAIHRSFQLSCSGKTGSLVTTVASQ